MKSTMTDYPLSLASLLRHGAEIHGETVLATCTEDGSRQARYADVAERAARLADVLRGCGITGDERVATFLWNDQEHTEAYLAVPAMGAVLHTLNIRLFPDQLSYIAAHADDRVLIVGDSLVPLLAPVLPRLATVQTVLVTGGGDRTALDGCGKDVLDYEEALASASPEPHWADVDERDAAAMCYTSGTTGDPKGVVYSHRSTYLHAMANCTGATTGMGQSDRVLPVVPMFHANAWGLVHAAWMSGAGLDMPGRFLQAEPLVRFMGAQHTTLTAGVPTIWNDLLLYLRAHPEAKPLLSSLRQVLCGGSAVPRSLMEAFDDELGIEVKQAWGMTETSPVATSGDAPADITDPAERWTYRVSAGRPLCGVEARIVADDDTVLPADGESVGELEVRGLWVTGSYAGDDSGERFHDGWLRTGDVGHISTRGYITLTDRSKDVIKSGGEWISSVELETTLIGHPDIVDVAVVGVPDPRWQERPLAAVVLRAGVDPTAETAAALRVWLGDRVVRWWLPERWAFVPAVPRTGVGKFDKKVIRRQHALGELTVLELDAEGTAQGSKR
jgi:fatty-acyl-CoA synthase